MTDPYDALRRGMENAEHEPIDPAFRAAVIANARRRIAEGSKASFEINGLTVPPTPIALETMLMTTKKSSRTRPMLLAAAVALAVVGGVAFILAVRDPGAPSPAVNQPTADDPIGTVAPTTTIAVTTTSTIPVATTTTNPVVSTTAAPAVPRLTDAEIAHAVLLDASEYGPDWIVLDMDMGEYGVGIDPAAAAGARFCEPFLDTVFEPLGRGAGESRWFYHAAPTFSSQYVAVLEDATTAQSVFDAINSTDFSYCVTSYGVHGASGAVSELDFPSPVQKPIAEPPFAPLGDALAYRTYRETWYDEQGVDHGPRTVVDAVLLVDRTITFMGTMIDGEDGTTVSSDEQFAAALQHVVDRAREATAP